MVKTCKLCQKNRYTNTSWCWKHYQEREKIKKEEKVKKKLERKLNSVKFQDNLRKKLANIAWKLQSEWIRRKDANLDGFVECYTCLKMIEWKKANAGHFKHGRLDHDDRNLKVQCVQCNKWNHGELDVYADRLIQENGLEWFNQLVRDAWQHPGYTIQDYKNIIEDLKIKISKL